MVQVLTRPSGTDPEGVAMGIAMGGLGAIGGAAALVGVRGQVSAANVALVLVSFVLLGGLVGGRVAGAASAVIAAMSFDFFHTQPYNSLKIARSDDVQTVVILLIIGVIVGEMGAWARRGRQAMKEDRAEIRRIHRVAESVAQGEPLDDLILSVAAEISGALMLTDCRFDRSPAEPLAAVLGHDGRVVAPHHRHARAGVGLPPDGLQLSVLGRGREVGRLVLMPTPGVSVSRERRLIAVALADQLGQALAEDPRHATSAEPGPKG
jgi:hypothetical protein